MRQIGTLASKQAAERFADFLTTKGVSTHAEEGNGEWSIWVKEEDHLETSRVELARFAKEPDHPDYANATAEARQLRSEAQRRREQAARNLVEVRNTWSRPLVRRAPCTAALLGLCIVVGLFSRTVFRPPAGAQDEALREYKVLRALAFQDPVRPLGPAQGGLSDIVGRGQIWRLFTPALIHYGLGHIIFNLFIFHALGGPIETRQGSLRLAVLVLLTAIAGNVGQYAVSGSTMMGGMSGVCYGLFGYLWIRMMLAPQDGLGIRKETVVILIVWLVLGFTGILNQLLGVNIANWAHLFGMLMGMLIAWITVNIEQIVGPTKSA